jgi:hypothetical protein
MQKNLESSTDYARDGTDLEAKTNKVWGATVSGSD